MQFNRVTWYSKLLALILFVSLPFIFFYLGMKYQELTSVKSTLIVNQSKTATKSASASGKASYKKVSLKTSYSNGVLTYSGSVTVPTPCDNIKTETIILDSFPEQVQVKITTITPDPKLFCAAMLTEKTFSGEAKVSAEAKISVYLDGVKVNIST